MSYVMKQRMGNGKTHLYLATNRRVSGRKHPVQERVYLGVLDEAANELLLGRNTAFPDNVVLSALAKLGLGFSGRRSPRPGRKRRSGSTETTVPGIKVCISQELGRVVLLEKLASSQGLTAALSQAFGEPAAGAILATAIYQCVEGGAMYRVDDWADDTCLAERGMSLSPASLTRLCDEIGGNGDCRNEFFREWFLRCGSPRALVHDTTSISSYAEKLNFVEWGYNRDKEDLPQVNLAMVYSRETQLPLHYRLICGSIPDVATLVNTSKMLKELGLDLFNYSLDRGYFSAGNLRFMKENELGFTIGVPIGHGQAASLALKNKNTLRSFKSVIKTEKGTLHHAADDYIVKPQAQGLPHRLRAHIYLNLEEKARLTSELETLLSGMIEQFEKDRPETVVVAEEWLVAMAGKHRKLFVVRKNKDKVLLEVAEKSFAAETKNFGVFMILNSDMKATAEETLRDNKARDAVEKLFDTLKNSTGNDRLKGFSDKNVEGRVFVAYLSVILHHLMEKKLREVGLLNKYTVKKAFDLLRKIKVVIFADGTRIVQEIPKKTRELLDAVNLGIEWR